METILTREFCLQAIKKAEIDIDLSAEEARYLIYFQHNPDECFPEGSIMRNTCDNPNCVSPHHTEIIDPGRRHLVG